jgi:hypothetical protein
MKKITVTASEQALQWIRKKAAKENTSVSKLVTKMLEDEMRRTSVTRQAANPSND